MKSEAFRSEKLGTLTGEYEQAAVDLRETQERLRDEWEDRRSCHQMLTQMHDTRAWREDQDSEAPETRATTYRSLT